MKNDIISDCKRLMKNYPITYQEKEKDPLIIVKLFNIHWNWIWFLTEFNPETKIAFGYNPMRWICEYHKNWFYFNIDELSKIYCFDKPAIVLDKWFRPKPFSEVYKELYWKNLK